MVRQDKCYSLLAKLTWLMPESMGKWSDGKGHRKSVTMRKLSIGNSYKHMMQR